MCISRKVVVVVLLLLLLLPLPLLVPLPLLPTARMFRPFRPLARATFVRMFYGGPAAKRDAARSSALAALLQFCCLLFLTRCPRLFLPRSCFLRGSHVRFMVLPDILKNAPFFKKIETKQAKQAAAKSSASKAKQAAQQRAGGRREVGMPEKQKRAANKANPNFS
jgi:hypothetical protein